MSQQTAKVQGFVAAAYVRLLYEYLAEQGRDAEAVLGRPAPGERENDGRFPVGEWRALLERANQALDVPALGLAVGATVRPAHLGVLGYVTTHCANLGEALARLEKYERLIYEVSSSRIALEGGSLVLEWGQERGRPGQLVDETAISVLVSFARALLEEAPALHEVTFINPPPADLGPYESYFGCPVRFAQPTTRVCMPAANLALPLRSPDPALRELLDRQAEELLTRLPDEDAFERALRVAMSQSITDGRASLETVAAHLHRAPRTLQRQLAARDVSFQRMLDDTRRRMAENYLADARLGLAEIAQLLGYAEQSAFNRAFKRWTGETPKRFRQQLSG